MKNFARCNRDRLASSVPVVIGGTALARSVSCVAFATQSQETVPPSLALDRWERIRREISLPGGAGQSPLATRHPLAWVNVCEIPARTERAFALSSFDRAPPVASHPGLAVRPLDQSPALWQRSLRGLGIVFESPDRSLCPRAR